MATGNRSTARKSVIGDVICALTTPHLAHVSWSASRAGDNPAPTVESPLEAFVAATASLVVFTQYVLRSSKFRAGAFISLHF